MCVVCQNQNHIQYGNVAAIKVSFIIVSIVIFVLF